MTLSWRTLHCLTLCCLCLMTSDLYGQAAADKTTVLADSRSEVRAEMLAEVEDHLDKTKSALAELRRHNQSLSRFMKDLSTNDAGKRIASDRDLVLSYIDDVEHPPLAADELHMYEGEVERVEAALKKLQESTEGGSVFREAYGHGETLGGVIAWTKSRQAALTERKDRWSAAMTKTKDVDIANAKTLGEVVRLERVARINHLKDIIEGLEREYKSFGEGEIADAELQRQAMLLEKRIGELQARNAALNVEKEKRVAELERQLALSQAEVRKMKAETTAAVQQIENDAEMVLLRQKCRSERVRSLLEPFTAASFWQPGNEQADAPVAKGPMSLSRLREAGALDNTPRGLTALLMIACRERPNDSRPKWSFGKNSDFNGLNDQDKETMVEAQGYLRDLGTALVAEGMLAP